MTSLTAFNTCLLQWIDDLIETYPDDYDFKTFKLAVSGLKKTNPRQIHTSFVRNITPYRDAISKRDEAFIISEASAELEGSSIQDASFLIQKLHRYWSDMTEHNREANWKYIDLLIALADRC
jgi:hypothetical protein